MHIHSFVSRLDMPHLQAKLFPHAFLPRAGFSGQLSSLYIPSHGMLSKLRQICANPMYKNIYGSDTVLPHVVLQLCPSHFAGVFVRRRLGAGSATWALSGASAAAFALALAFSHFGSFSRRVCCKTIACCCKAFRSEAS